MCLVRSNQNIARSICELDALTCKLLVCQINLWALLWTTLIQVALITYSSSRLIEPPNYGCIAHCTARCYSPKRNQTYYQCSIELDSFFKWLPAATFTRRLQTFLVGFRIYLLCFLVSHWSVFKDMPNHMLPTPTLLAHHHILFTERS